MYNLFPIVGKDFSELIGNRSVVVVIFLFICFVIFTSIYSNELIISSTSREDVLQILLYQLSYAIMSYGSIIAVLIGFFSMSNEKIGKAMNTLVTKPVYRDTIINGKILTCCLFLTIILSFAVAIYTAVIVILGGELVGSVLSDFLVRLPLVFSVVFLDALFYMSLSILLSILITRTGVGLLSTMVLFIFLDVIEPSVSFAANIATILGSNDLYYYLSHLSPSSTLYTLILNGLFDPSVSQESVLLSCYGDIVKIILFIVILLFLCYSSFIRRDIV
ncbi:ABC transporter permease [Methanocella sp. MCL-LM]|uniref:ABC transporter permease n=1 Tax=Methanocella sp. MCL-LM TaxID=3412035 RepID=UPI003C7330E2